MKYNSLIWLSLGLSMTLAITSCKKDEIPDPVIPNEQEIITTLNYTLIPIGGGTEILMSLVDMDGDGPQAPVISVSDSLAANAQYSAELLLLNETETPSDTINVEIIAEADEHQFFFVTEGLDLTVAYSDSDGDGNPIGLSTVIDTATPSEGTLKIILRHEPDKSANGVAQGDISNAGGETDIEATFDVVIQ